MDQSELGIEQAMQPVSGFEMRKLRQEVQKRWLKPREVLHILQNHEHFKVTLKPLQRPPSGSLFLFNRRVLRYFRNDGYEWRRKKNGKTIAESHEFLKVDNVDALNCYYAHGEKNPTFQRRIYWMLDPAYEHIVLVHYREVSEGAIAAPTPNDSSTSYQNASITKVEAPSLPYCISALTGPCLKSCSPGSVEEVSSQLISVGNGTHYSGAEWIETCDREALRQLEIELSLDDDDDCKINCEEVPSNDVKNEAPFLNDILSNSSDYCELIGCDISNGSSQEIPDNMLDGCSKNGQIKEPRIPGVSSAIDVLTNSDAWLEEDQLEAILLTASMPVMENQWFSIRAVSPEWAFSSESTKVIIVGDLPCSTLESSWAVLFGDVEVPLETVQQGVIRCHAPCGLVGKVKLCVTDGNGKPCSEICEFEFREKPSVKSSEELSLLIDFVHMLLDETSGELISKFRCGSEVNHSETLKKRGDWLDHENTVNCIMEELLNDKFGQWLSSKCQKNTGGDFLLPRECHGTIHATSALGYHWALNPLLSSGVPVNHRDANGWTALHWAARFGREKMVAALFAAGASAGALSYPTSEDPVAKTPASIASAYGYKGLSAYLSEAELTSHLDSLASKENENRRDCTCGEEMTRAVDRVSEKRAHSCGGTEDQLALKDSLAATRNAVQAAGRIQAAFRAFSFRKKQQDTAQTSEATFEKAALCIQKNFRCWEKRKEFLTIRKHVIKMQAHVRAYQERRKYKELLKTVGIFEKVIIRWHRRGVGLRGFHPGAMQIDEEEEDDLLKVFRKQRVETALNEAVSRVSSIIDNPDARQQYRRMLERYHEAKNEQEKQQSC